MSVAIEINRSRIGSHHKFTQGIYIGRSHLFSAQGGGLRTMENPGRGVKKALENPGGGVKLPCLKNLVTKTEKYNEVCMWYVQMVCYYHVHVPLLLRLSNKY
jgi:hypothetical protein